MAHYFKHGDRVWVAGSAITDEQRRELGLKSLKRYVGNVEYNLGEEGIHVELKYAQTDKERLKNPDPHLVVPKEALSLIPHDSETLRSGMLPKPKKRQK
jgi:hypothetical protein